MRIKALQFSLGPSILLLALSVSVAWSTAQTRRYIVSFRDGTPVATQNDILDASGGTILKRFPLLNAVVIRIAPDRAKAALDTLRLYPEVESIERDTSISAQGMATGGRAGSLVAPESDPSLVAGGYTWNLLQIELDRLDQPSRGGGVGVAVVDTGVDPEHPALRHAMVGCYNARLGEDPDDCADRNGHGTHIAGIIATLATSRSRSQVMRGVAPGVRLYAVRVLNDDGGGGLSNLVNGLMWVYEQPGISVVNMSLGFYEGSAILRKLIRMLHEAGVTMVAAAGNYDVVAASEGGESEGGESLGASSEGGESEGGESEGGESEGGESEGGESVTVIKCRPAAASEGGESLGASSEGGESEGGESEGGESEGGESEGGDSECRAVEMYPAKYRETIAVAATDIDKDIAYYSLQGKWIDLAAPGGTRSVPVISTTTTLDATVLNLAVASEGGESEGGESLWASSEGGESEGGESASNRSTGLYGWASGTSQAAAHVTGVVALMLQINPALRPDEVRTLLEEGAIDLGLPVAAQGAGLINAPHAVRGALRTRQHR
jgi:subtilisin family serine protease